MPTNVVAMAYTIGGISGCHINPAINSRWLAGRNHLHLRIRAGGAWSHCQDQRCHQQLCWISHWPVAGTCSSGVHPLYGYFREPSSLYCPSYLPGRHSTGQPMDLHRRAVSRRCMCCRNMENDRAFQVIRLCKIIHITK